MSGSNSLRDIYLLEDDLRELLTSIGVVVYSSTSSDIIAMCPFHHNRDTPAFTISLEPNHPWMCHNGSCGQKGNILSLLTKKGYTFAEAKKMLELGAIDDDRFVALIKRLLQEEVDSEDENYWDDVDPMVFVQQDADAGYPAKQYLLSRGITEEAYDFFGIGFSKKKNMLVIPVIDDRGALSGIIGRDINSKKYQYSSGMNRTGLIWNINNAMEHDSIVLTEGALDSIYLWQAGVPNVGAIFGSSISGNQIKLLRKHFFNVVGFFDNDSAGESAMMQLVNECGDIGVDVVRYTNPEAKDPGDLTKEEICEMMENKISSVQLLFD